MERHDGPPVQLAQQTPRVEPRLLPEDAATLLVLLHGQVEPRQPRQPHLGPQPQELPVRSIDDLLDPPPVDGVADPQVVRVAPASQQPGAAAEDVEPAADLPGQRPRVPAVGAADALDHRPQRLRAGSHGGGPLVDVEAAAGPVRVARHGIGGRARRRRGGPAGRDVGVADPLQRQLDGAIEPDQSLRRVGDVADDVPVLDHHLVDEALDERAGDAVRDRCHDADPVGRQPRRQQGDRDDEPVGEPGDRGVALHHLAVGEDLGAADVERAVDVGGHRRAADEVPQHVADRDGLDAGADPARGDHHGEALGEVAQHLEGRGARSQDDRRAQHGRGDAAGEEDLADLLAGVEVPRQQLALGVEAAEVDDPAHAHLARGPGEGQGRPAVRRFEKNI